jgi:hypothetical protein
MLVKQIAFDNTDVLRGAIGTRKHMYPLLKRTAFPNGPDESNTSFDFSSEYGQLLGV